MRDSSSSSRREFLYGLGASLGSIAFSDLIARESVAGSLALKRPMHEPRAKAVIMLVMEGGPSHIDTFDPKPHREPAYIHELYGLNETETEPFGRKCLLARRLVEEGVRFIQIFSGGWDSHDYLERAHRKRIYSVDKPIAALITDLKARGMLNDTLVMWTGEFGRTPDNTRRGGETALGRDHNAQAMSMFFAGGGVKAGHVIGGTDEIGGKATEVAHPIRDVHVTLLHLLGLDDNQLTYFHGGRFKQLSQFGGAVISELLA